MEATTRRTSSGRARWALRLLIAAAAAAAIATLLAAGDRARGADPSQPSEFTLTLKENAQRIVDNPPRGENPTIGDSAAFNKILLDASAKRVGSVQAHGTITAAGKDPSETIEGVAILAGGRLMLQESFKFSDRVHHIAITGGTGKYEGATGTVTSGLRGQGEDDLLFRVRLP
jgi:hypothetical protein